eukprot:s6943_g1.t1
MPPVQRLAFTCRYCSGINARDDERPGFEWESFPLEVDGDELTYVVIRGHQILGVSVEGPRPEVRNLQYMFGSLEETRCNLQDEDIAETRVQVRVEGTSVSAAIPKQLVKEAGGNIVVLMEASSSVDNEPCLDFVQNLTNNSDTTVLAVPAVSVKLWAGAIVAVRDLAEPILITLSEEAMPNAECVFWNETEQQCAWKFVPCAAGGTGLVCSTTHLSIFSAILRQLECLNIQVLSAAGLEMASAVEWTDKPSAILLYAVMVFWLSLMVFAWRRDLLYLQDLSLFTG